MTAMTPLAATGAMMIGIAVTGLLAAGLARWWRVDPAHRFAPRMSRVGLAALLAALAVPLAEYGVTSDRPVAVDGAFAAQMAAIPWWTALPLLALAAPFLEEVLFRGVLLVRLADRLRSVSVGGAPVGPPAAAAVTALLFGALHVQYDWVGMTATALLGLFLAVARLGGASLGAVVAVHAVNNAAAILIG